MEKIVPTYFSTRKFNIRDRVKVVNTLTEIDELQGVITGFLNDEYNDEYIVLITDDNYVAARIIKEEYLIKL